MEVRCNRCGTEYEFDDVLISERGTTVKCTNCGFQFKVFAPGTRHTPERWVVRTLSGAELSFGSLRDLQRGIADQRVGPQDLLSRGDEVPRRLGLIAELEPFFVVQESAPRGPIQRTLHGVAPQRTSDGPYRASDTPHPTSAPATLVESRRDFAQGQAAPTLRTTPIPEPEPKSAVVSTHAAQQSGERASRPSQSTPIHLPVQRVNSSPATRDAVERLSATLPSAPSPSVAPPSPARASGNAEPRPPISGGALHDLELDDDPGAGGSVRSRWIAALVVAGVLVLLASTVGRRYLTRAAQAPEPEKPVATSDPRVNTLLAEGTRALDDGDWDAARERLVKASALAERDGRVLSALARLETLRADLAWLELRLVDPKAIDSMEARRRELERRFTRAGQAVDAALAELPQDPAVLRSQVDVLRMKGETAKARERIAPIAAGASEPANAYVLAALDVAEDVFNTASVVDRLKLAASAERGGGRAQALLAYVLGRAGRLPEAEAELTKFGPNSPLIGIVPELKAFLPRAALGARGSAKPAPSAVAADAGKDGRKALDQAKKALQNGQYALAEELYYRILETRPGNPEALAALGDIARKKNDPKRAEELYERALDDNPNYLPALAASADQKWQSGDRKGAVVIYRQVLERAGAGSALGNRAQARIAEAASNPEPVVPSEAVPKDAAPKSAAPKTDVTTQSDASKPAASPDIDTTDLPESK